MKIDMGGVVNKNRIWVANSDFVLQVMLVEYLFLGFCTLQIYCGI